MAWLSGFRCLIYTYRGPTWGCVVGAEHTTEVGVAAAHGYVERPFCQANISSYDRPILVLDCSPQCPHEEASQWDL